MEIKNLKALVMQGEIEEAVRDLTQFVDAFHSRFNKEILLISSRYNQVKSEKISGTIPVEDYKIEMNSITYNVISILESIEDLSSSNLVKKKEQKDVEQDIIDLAGKFDTSRKRAKNIQSTPSRLREKNELVRKLGEVFIDYPDLAFKFSSTENEGIIAGIAHKFKIIPDIVGIDIFETFAHKVTGNFTRGCIANSLAEIIYSGQLRFGDDSRIFSILETLAKDADEPLMNNIVRVRSDLDYLLGRKNQ